VSSASVASAARTVLVVDDCQINRMIAEACLKTEGYRVLAAEDGPAAVATVRREAVDVVLLDMRMPGMDGSQVIQSVRDALGGSGPAFLLMTAMSDAESAAQAREIGADGSCAKPYAPKLLREHVRALLLRRQERAGEGAAV
jgi:CheY-like chemotaxis protein